MRFIKNVPDESHDLCLTFLHGDGFIETYQMKRQNVKNILLTNILFRHNESHILKTYANLFLLHEPN